MINMYRRVPLAWLNLTHSTRRFLVSVLGISFAVLLMLVELGFWRALLDSQTAIIQDVDADLILVSVAQSTITDDESFPIERIEMCKGVSGVAWAQPLYIRYLPFVWKNRDASGGVLDWPIRAIAFVPDAEHPAFRAEQMPGFAAAQSTLRQPHTAELDDRSKRFYDAMRTWRGGGPSPVGVEREVGGQTLRITGLFRLGTDFTTDGNILISDRTLAAYGPGPDTLKSVKLGLIKLAPDADRDAVRDNLRQTLPPDVRILKPSKLIAEEEAFWTQSTPVGFVFTLGLVVGFVVGVVICYQVLSTEVTDHLSEFATLKAMGYRDRYINGIVLQEALWLSLLGFAVGFLIGWPLYTVLENSTGLPMKITLGRAGLILVLTIAMCALSGFLAARRVRSADPAEVFG